MPRGKPNYPFLERYGSAEVPERVVFLINRAMNEPEGKPLSDRIQDKYWQLKELVDRIGGIGDHSPEFIFHLVCSADALPDRPKRQSFADLKLRPGELVKVMWHNSQEVGKVLGLGDNRLVVDINGKDCQVDGQDVVGRFEPERVES